jgi:hypothetical protein
VFGGWGEYKNSDCSQTWDFEEESVEDGALDFWLSDCDSLVLDYGSYDRIVSPHIPRGWVEIGYSIQGQMIGSAATIFSNGMVVSSGHLAHTIFNGVGDKNRIGSWDGNAYQLRGFIYDFTYSQAYISTPDQWAEIFYNSQNAKFADEFIECDWDQYLDAESECEECDATCSNGCTSGEICYECHADCMTCLGPGSDDCVDCRCHSHRVDLKQLSSCCECDAPDWSGSPQVCEESDCSEECEFCISSRCATCAYGYHFDHYRKTCEQCNPVDCSNPVHGLPDCTEIGERVHQGTCNCAEEEQDDIRCKDCSPGCAECEDGICEACRRGYFRFEDTDLCLSSENLQNLSLPDEMDLVLSFQDQELFTFSLNVDWGGDYDERSVQVDFQSVAGTLTYRLHKGAINSTGDRHGGLHLETRGMWFDGKYDFLTLSGILFPKVYVSFWVNPYTSGTLLSNNAVHDASD